MLTHKLAGSIHTRNISQGPRPYLIPVVGCDIVFEPYDRILASVHGHLLLLKYLERSKLT